MLCAIFDEVLDQPVYIFTNGEQPLTLDLPESYFQAAKAGKYTVVVGYWIFFFIFLNNLQFQKAQYEDEERLTIETMQNMQLEREHWEKTGLPSIDEEKEEDFIQSSLDLPRFLCGVSRLEKRSTIFCSNHFFSLFITIASIAITLIA